MGFGAAVAAGIAGALLSLQPVIVQGDHPLRSAPDVTAFAAGTVYDGQIVRIERTAPGWMEVVRLDGTSGWISPADAVATAPCRPAEIGTYNAGSLYCGWTLAARTDTYTTWDFPLGRSPSRAWRRAGTDR